MHIVRGNHDSIPDSNQNCTPNTPFIFEDDEEIYSPENIHNAPTIDSIPPIQDILNNHPAYISPTLLGIESVNTCNIDIPIRMI